MKLIKKNSALKSFIEKAGLEEELKMAIPDSPFGETDSDCSYFLLDNLKRKGFSDEFDKQVREGR